MVQVRVHPHFQLGMRYVISRVAGLLDRYAPELCMELATAVELASQGYWPPEIVLTPDGNVGWRDESMNLVYRWTDREHMCRIVPKRGRLTREDTRWHVKMRREDHGGSEPDAF